MNSYFASFVVPLDEFLVHFTKDALQDTQTRISLIHEREQASGILFPTVQRFTSAEESHPNDPFHSPSFLDFSFQLYK